MTEDCNHIFRRFAMSFCLTELVRWMQEKGLQFQVVDLGDGDYVIKSGFTTTGSFINLSLFATNVGKALHAYAIGSQIPSGAAKAVNSLLARVRRSIVCGAMFLDEDLNVAFRSDTYAPSERRQLVEAIEILVASAFGACSVFHPAVLSMVFANATPEEAYKAALINDRKAA